MHHALLSLGPDFLLFQIISHQKRDLFLFCGKSSLFAMLHITVTHEDATLYLCSTFIYFLILTLINLFSKSYFPLFM